jgi:hypothetical protein
MEAPMTTITDRADAVIAQAQDIRDTVLNFEDFPTHAKVLALAVDQAKTAREAEHQGLPWAADEVAMAERTIETAGRFYTKVLLNA